MISALDIKISSKVDKIGGEVDKIGGEVDKIGQMQGEQGMELQLIRQSVPQVALRPPLTPSGASMNRDETDDLLRQLNLSNEPIKDDGDYAPDDEEFAAKKDFTWSWAAGNRDQEKPEESAYEPLAKHIADLGYLCVNVANGQRLGQNQLLFDAQIFTLRREGDASVRGQNVTYIRRVKGRTDLVVLDRHVAGDIMVNHVHVAIEVKTPSAMSGRASTSGCMREAMVQLIGLNAYNNVRSPPVLLTNLLRIHKVVYLQLVSNSPLRYEIRVRVCKSFNAALHFALTLGKEFESISSQFGRPITPVDE